MGQPHFIVFANEKGGTGKSTTAVHTAIALAASGHRVGALDLDSRQRTMTRYLENRDATMRRLEKNLPQARYEVLEEQSEDGLDAALDRLAEDAGRHRHRHARPRRSGRPRRDPARRHAGHADERQLRRPRPDRPGPPRKLQDHQAELLCRADLEQPHRSAPRQTGKSVDWVVLRNRLQHIEAHNLRRVGAALDELARRVGFRVIPGLGERVIYRELFPKGLTLLDLQQLGEVGIGHIAARQELREMIAGLGIPGRGAEQRGRSQLLA